MDIAVSAASPPYAMQRRVLHILARQQITANDLAAKAHIEPERFDLLMDGHAGQLHLLELMAIAEATGVPLHQLLAPIS